ncbi:hypothetical protein D3P09_04880 [Paenibacillus pinisoli]|uniref:Uncharacterized protein n=1 Tax=Paenibacillus pinisoli TaxID=1276110 RepID=A0A3A6PLS9_9BACL|nr:hypothetical protein [Paenibacillus pinisoli]RJX41320.1 hypothetical protein D3P09_04880 [Paenibacillus pinisoli]
MKHAASTQSYFGKLVRIWLSLFLSMLFGYFILIGVHYFIDSNLPNERFANSFLRIVIMQALFTFVCALILSKRKIKLPTLNAAWRMMIALYIPLILGFLLVLDYGNGGLVKQWIDLLGKSVVMKESIRSFILMAQIMAGLIFLKPWRGRTLFLTGIVYASVLYLLLNYYELLLTWMMFGVDQFD